MVIKNVSKQNNKYIEDILILHDTGFPIYYNFNDNGPNCLWHSLIDSGLFPLIIGYSKKLGTIDNVSEIKLKHSEIFFYINQNLVFVLIIKEKLLRVNKKTDLVNELMKKLNEVFSNELNMRESLLLSKEMELIIKSKIESILHNIFNKGVLLFYF